MDAPFSRTAALLLAACIGAGASQALACATCGCTLSKDWVGPQAGSVSGWTAGLSYDYINQDRYRRGSRDLDPAAAQAVLNPPGHPGNEVELQTATRTIALDLAYSGDDWGVSVQLPWVDRDHTTLADGTAAGLAVSRFSVPGDLKLVARYAGGSEEGDSGVTVGAQLPTGSTDQRFANGQPLDAGLQPGSGATQLLLGAFTSGAQGRLGWFVQGSWQHAVVSRAGYTPGDALLLNSGLRWAAPGQAVVPLLQLNLVRRSADHGTAASVAWDGSALTGGTLAYLAPGLAVNVGGGVTAFGYLQLPLHQEVNGVQLVPHQILSLGLRKFF